MKKRKSLYPRLMALFLAVLLAVSMVPISVFAADSPVSEPSAEVSEPPDLPQEDPPELTQPPETEVPAEETVPDTAAEESSEPLEEVPPKIVLTEPVPLETKAIYYEDYFARLTARQDGLAYQIITANADFSDPQIHAYPFEIDPDVPSVGFEIKLSGVTYSDDPVVSPGGELTVTIENIFENSNPDAIQVFDISGDSWTYLPHDRFEVYGADAVISFYAPKLNSRFAIVEGFTEAALYDVSYSTNLGDYVTMGVNNKTSWGVYGPNPHGFGNSSTGTFALHLVSRPSTDPNGCTVGYKDYVAAGCLEYWLPAPTPSQGQVVSVTFGGSIGGWNSLTEYQRRLIVGYMLYGVRYLSDGSFDNNLGDPTVHSSNAVVNMTYAQQILIWSAVKGIDPYEALSYYEGDVYYYGDLIISYANSNPENYNYDETLLLVGEGDSQQDLIIILKPSAPPPPWGDLLLCKAAYGSDVIEYWIMEVYDSYENAAAAVNPLYSSYSDAVGEAWFYDLPNGTYYVREAPAERQEGDLSGWTLSDEIFTVQIEGNTVNAGTVYNSYQQPCKYGIKKVSHCTADVKKQIAGNKLYSLAGAEYEVRLNGVLQETLTTNAKGVAKGKMAYQPGTRLTLREVKAPPGYKLDPTEHLLVVTTGNNILQVEDEPVFDPPFAITKVDPSTTVPQGDSSFSGAVFKFEYFPNDKWNGTPKRTWYFKTNNNGIADYHPDDLAPGYQSDLLYVDNGGIPTLPLGTLTITEVENSLGYTVLPEPLKCRIAADPEAPTGASHLFDEKSLQYIKDISAGNVGILEPIDKNSFGAFSLQKVDAVTGSTPQGNGNLSAKFQVINRSSHAVQIEAFQTALPDEVCYEFTTDAAGFYTSQKLFPLGTYEIRESEPPEGYELNTKWNQTFTVTEGNSFFPFTLENGKACPDQPKSIGSFSMQKLDMDTGSQPQGDGTLEGAVFELINNSDQPIYMENKPIAPGQVVLTFHTDKDGCYEFTGLPFGSYYLQEVTPPEGYLWDSVWQYDFEITSDQPHAAIAPEHSCQNYILRGGLRILKQDAQHLENTTEDDPLSGITFSVINRSLHPVMVEGKCYEPGQIVTTLEIQWDGSAWTAETGMILPYGTYGVKENEASPGMANEQYHVNSEEQIVEVHDDSAVCQITCMNALSDGKIIIHKVDPLGKPLAGARFQLLWSDDGGSTWNPVISSLEVTRGGCREAVCENGTLVSDENGMIVFSGLHPELLYRVVEMEAPDGYVLLSEPAFEGKLSEHEFVYTMTVHNFPGFTLPASGSQGLYLLMVVGFSLTVLSCMGIIYKLTHRKQKSVTRERSSHTYF